VIVRKKSVRFFPLNRSPFLGPAEATFVSSPRSKSGSTDLPEGVVHIFRDAENKPSPEELTKPTTETLPQDEDAGVTLGVLAIPSWMNPSDFLDFIGPAVEGIAHLRLIRFVLI
jgi:BRCA1-associated protein